VKTLNVKKRATSAAVEKVLGNASTMRVGTKDLNIETIQCGYCGVSHTYERKRKAKLYCSNKCGVAFHGKYVRDKAKLALRVTSYYKNNYAKRLIVTSKQSANKKQIAHTVTEKHINSQLATGCCQVTGLPIKSNIGTGEKRGSYSPSLDRIDNSVGYHDSNVRIVSWGYNVAKNKFSDRDLNNLAIALTASHLGKNERAKFKALLPLSLLAGLPAGYKL